MECVVAAQRLWLARQLLAEHLGVILTGGFDDLHGMGGVIDTLDICR
jgi:hypothetical protein